MQAIPKHIFRANDIRGIANTDLCTYVVKSIAGAFGEFLLEKGIKSLGLAYDVRLTSPRIYKAYREELMKFPIEIYELGMIPSPVGYFVNHHFDEIEAVSIITASHNPPEYNGIKFCIQGNSMTQQCIAKLYNRTVGYQPKKEKLAKCKSFPALEEYIRYLSGLFPIENNFKIALDPANATGSLIAPALLNELNQSFVIINEDLDGTFPNHHPDPTVASNMKQLSELVTNEGADLGIGFDGDSDRIGVVDDKGRFIPGDILIALFAQDLLIKNPGASVVIEVKSSQLLIDTIEKSGGQVQMSKVGHSFIKQKIIETNALLAGELSGHMFFCDDYYGFDDAFYCMLRLIKLLSEQSKKLSDLIDAFPVYYNTPEIHLQFGSDKDKFDTFKEIELLFDSHDNISRIDGLRIMFEDGWGVIRPSNTQAVIVTRYEGRTQESLDSIKSRIEERIDLVFDGEKREQ